MLFVNFSVFELFANNISLQQGKNSYDVIFMSSNYKEILKLKIKKNYIINRYDKVISISDEFIEKFPFDIDISYVYYIRSAAHLEKTFDTKRDVTDIENAFNKFIYFIYAYPDSIFIYSVQKKIIYASNVLAKKCMSIAKFYLEKNDLVSAIIYYKQLIVKHTTSIFIPEAYYKVHIIYKALSLDYLSDQYYNKLFMCCNNKKCI